MKVTGRPRLHASAPNLWVTLPDRIAPDRAACARSVIARVAELREQGCPVLLVTRNQAACGFWSEALAKAGMEHQFAGGCQDEKEAAAFAAAAAPGRITVAPHFVARGCAVDRCESTEKLGGLRVIFLQLFPTRRHLHSLPIPKPACRSARQRATHACTDDEILVKLCAGLVAPAQISRLHTV